MEVRRTSSSIENVTLTSVMNSGGNASNCNMSDKDSLLRVDEFEKTVKFLKDEQKRMLCNLHQEIASLQSKNRGTRKDKFVCHFWKVTSLEKVHYCTLSSTRDECTIISDFH